jgi:predicted nucleic acid-binding protein
MPNDSTDDNDKRMLDTNILVYAFTAHDPHKQQIALALVEQLLQEENLMLSAQVLNEFYSVLTRSSRKTPMSHDEAVTALRRLTTSGAHVVSLNEATTFLALDAVSRHGMSFWDALIWAAAKEGGATMLYSEDFQHGRDVEGVKFENPFLSP